jgi:DNA-binding NarL/FixJ family response regulator
MQRILVIEDEFFVAAHMEHVLRAEGVEVVGPVGSLNEARHLASHEEIDGALLDVNIEGGRIDDIAEILARKHIPFVFVTGFGQDSLPAAHRRAIVIDKPFRDEDLIREVRRFGRRP